MLSVGSFIVRIVLRVLFGNIIVEGLGGLFGVVVLILFALGIDEGSIWSTLGEYSGPLLVCTYWVEVILFVLCFVLLWCDILVCLFSFIFFRYECVFWLCPFWILSFLLYLFSCVHIELHLHNFFGA